MSLYLVVLLAGTFVPQAVPVPAAPVTSTDTPSEGSPDIVVQATRSGRRLTDEPVRVEVLDRDEIEEKILMRPGNIAMLLSETSGLRVQLTAPAIGAANIRVQGLDGRFTQLLADGLPLYGGQASSLGLLQIPPTDLGRVEVIKGAVSALYGASALGGVINLVSRKPGNTPEAEALLNATTQSGVDATAYLATPVARTIGLSLTAGTHRQGLRDLDDDGWGDIPGYRRSTLRSRLFWDADGGATVFVTGGVMEENRRGGTLAGRTVPDGNRFPLQQHSSRRDLGLVARAPVTDGLTVSLRAAGTVQDHRHVFGDVVERDRHDTRFVEVSVAAADPDRSTNWVVGAAYQRDDFHSRTRPAFEYRYDVPALFGQIEHDITPAVTLAASGRFDAHDRFGNQFSPRVSLLWRSSPWSVRVSAGRGYYAPTPFVEEIEAAGLSQLEPLGALKTETATTATVDLSYARGGWEANVTLFGANVGNPTELIATAADRVRLVNLVGDSRIRGVETLVRRRFDEVTVTATFAHIDATELDPGSGRRLAKPLTPRTSAGLVAMWERPGSHRVGVEVYHTGRQRLEDDPYRLWSRPYVEIGVLAEKTFGPIRLFLNAENILDIRQTRYDPILRRRRAADGRWTVDAWAPVEGFVLNGGIRLSFG